MSAEQGTNEIAIEFLIFQYHRSKKKTSGDNWPTIHTLDLWEYVYRIVDGRISIVQVERVMDSLEQSGLMKDRMAVAE